MEVCGNIGKVWAIYESFGTHRYGQWWTVLQFYLLDVLLRELCYVRIVVRERTPYWRNARNSGGIWCYQAICTIQPPLFQVFSETSSATMEIPCVLGRNVFGWWLVYVTIMMVRMYGHDLCVVSAVGAFKSHQNQETRKEWSANRLLGTKMVYLNKGLYHPPVNFRFNMRSMSWKHCCTRK